MVAETLRAEGWRVLAAGRGDGDLSRAAGARSLVEHAVAALGGLDLLVCAAADGCAAKRVAEGAEEDWDAALDEVAKGTFCLAQAAAPALREARGAIVVVEDVAAFQPWPSFAAHC